MKRVALPGKKEHSVSRQNTTKTYSVIWGLGQIPKMAARESWVIES